MNHCLLFVDLKHICQNLSQFGYGKGTKYGGCSEYTIIPTKYAYLLKTDLDNERASILERNTHNNIFITVLFFVLACGVAHQALEAIEPAGEDILILGCGPVGLLAVGVAKALGAVKVYANYSFLKLPKFWPFVIFFVLHITFPHCQFKVDFF